MMATLEEVPLHVWHQALEKLKIVEVADDNSLSARVLTRN
jgi:hypothetical protein